MRYLIGIGTYTGYDDSIGLRVAEAVAERGLDVDFAAIDLGGNLIDLLHYLDDDTETVLVVDSARMGLTPGDFVFFTAAQVSTTKETAGFSTHEGDLIKVLDLAEMLGKPVPPITIMGIEPAEIRDGMDLSETLGGRLDEYIEAAVGFLRRDR